VAEVVVEGVRKSFADPSGRAVAVLRGVDLRVGAGERFVLLGPSGCGKTTLLRIISGLERPDAGRVLMDGRDVTRLPAQKRPSAMVFQNYALFPHLTVAGNVAFGLRLRRMGRKEIERKVGEMLDLVQLSGLGRRRIDELSGGQQQRVALARVLAVEPKVLLLDEPLSNLDPALRRSTRSAIREIQSALGLTTIYITHDQEEGMAIADRLALMQEGRIVQAGTPRELYERPATVQVARFVGERNVVAATVSRALGDALLLAAGSEAQREERTTELLEVRPTPGGPRGDSPLKEGDAVWLAFAPGDAALERDEPAEAPAGSARPGASLERETAAAKGWPAAILTSAFAGESLAVELRLRETGDVVRVVEREMPAATGDPPREFARDEKVRLTLGDGKGLLYRRATA
jgi:iron(III) transport system ATP-binding protein